MIGARIRLREGGLGTPLDNPVGGWSGSKKWLRGRPFKCIPQMMERFKLTGVKQDPGNKCIHTNC